MALDYFIFVKSIFINSLNWTKKAFHHFVS